MIYKTAAAYRGGSVARRLRSVGLWGYGATRERLMRWLMVVRAPSPEAAWDPKYHLKRACLHPALRKHWRLSSHAKQYIRSSK